MLNEEVAEGVVAAEAVEAAEATEVWKAAEAAPAAAFVASMYEGGSSLVLSTSSAKAM